MPFKKPFENNVVSCAGDSAAVGQILDGYYAFLTLDDANGFAALVPEVADYPHKSPDKLYDFAARFNCVSGPAVAF